jgi:Spy/CpxP family protein refolding chaperone
MKPVRLVIIAAAIILAGAVMSVAQVVIQVRPSAGPPTAQSANDPDEDLIRAVFDPVTDDLKLTPGQKFRIVTIATATMTKADPLFEQLDDLDAQLSVAAFTGQLDETRIKQLSEKQAALLSQVIAIKARAKTNFYKVLTDEQRAMIVDRYRLRIENLGSIGSLDK